MVLGPEGCMALSSKLRPPSPGLLPPRDQGGLCLQRDPKRGATWSRATRCAMSSCRGPALWLGLCPRVSSHQGRGIGRNDGMKEGQVGAHMPAPCWLSDLGTCVSHAGSAGLDGDALSLQTSWLIGRHWTCQPYSLRLSPVAGSGAEGSRAGGAAGVGGAQGREIHKAEGGHTHTYMYTRVHVQALTGIHVHTGAHTSLWTAQCAGGVPFATVCTMYAAFRESVINSI